MTSENQEQDYILPVDAPAAPAVPCTHIAITVEVADQICQYFQTTRHLNWTEAQPYILSIMQGQKVTLKTVQSLPEGAVNH